MNNRWARRKANYSYENKTITVGWCAQQIVHIEVIWGESHLLQPLTPDSRRVCYILRRKIRNRGINWLIKAKNQARCHDKSFENPQSFKIWGKKLAHHCLTHRLTEFSRRNWGLKLPGKSVERSKDWRPVSWLLLSPHSGPGRERMALRSTVAWGRVQGSDKKSGKQLPWNSAAVLIAWVPLTMPGTVLRHLGGVRWIKEGMTDQTARKRDGTRVRIWLPQLCGACYDPSRVETVSISGSLSRLLALPG